jgi:hypothetical protein
MARVHSSWRLLAVLASLSCGTSLDSINLDLEVLENVDLSGLGTPNLDRFEGAYDLTVGDDCQYLLRVDFKKPSQDAPGNASPNFEGVCAPDESGGNAPDGKPWHEERRNWMQFPEYVDATTGFNHMSLYWKPCGEPPKGLRQPRYDMNFYNIIPQYRAFMTCQTFKSPKVCQYNQTSFLGRGHFSIPTLERDNNFLAGMPLGFQPDTVEPEAYEHEGLISYDNDLIPQTTEDWILPTFLMSTYDGDVVSWRAKLPYSFISGPNSSIYTATQFYVFQRNLRLPSRWNMTYDAPRNQISVYLTGSAGMCGEGFDLAKEEQEGNRKLRG